jgi:cytochrome c peroxidase
MLKSSGNRAVFCCTIFVVGIGLLLAAPVAAHQAVDPAILRLIKPRTGPAPGTIRRPPGDPLVERGRTLFFTETFGGNGRTCGTCHRANRNLTIDADFIRRLPKSDPLFVAEKNPALKELENPKLLRQFGLILENLDGFPPAGRGVLRGVPHTLGLRFTTGRANGVDLDGATGWSGDGAPGDQAGQRGTLMQFAVGAVVQHFAKSMNRVAGSDFVVPTQDQLDALLAFQLSLGRQAEMVVDPGLDGHLQFKDTNVTAGQKLFHGIGASRACSGCHAGGGAVTPGGAGLNVDTGVRRLPNAPACLDPTVPGDGGLGRDTTMTESLCGRSVEFRGNGTFNSPSIIEAADTPPFFHNNAVATLEGAVAFYTSPTFNVSPAGRFGVFDLDATEVNQVAAFLRALNAVDNIDNAQRSLAGASGRPSLLRLLRDPAVIDINDAARVLGSGPLRLFVGASPVPWLRAAVLNIGRGRISEAQVNLKTARSLIVSSPP